MSNKLDLKLEADQSRKITLRTDVEELVASPESEDVENGSLYDAVWSIQGDGNAGREHFTRLARRAVLALGQRFSESGQAVDFWLNRAHSYHIRCHSWHVPEPGRIKNLLEASAEYCAELATSFHEKADLDAEKEFLELEQQFHARPSALGLVVINHPWEYLGAVLRRDAVDPTELVAPVSTEREDTRAERRRLRDSYKAECKKAGVKLTDEMIAAAASPNWKSRDNIQKWLSGDPKYDGHPDNLIRAVFRKRPHLLKLSSTRPRA